MSAGRSTVATGRNMLLQSCIVTGDMLDQSRFRDAGAGDQCGLGRSNRFSDRLEKGLVLGPVANPDRVRLVMNVDMRVDWPHHRAIRFVRAETKDAGLAMIDSYDAMIVYGQGFVPAFSPSVETTGKSSPSSLNAKSFVAAVAMMMVVVVMLHRHRFGRSGERRQGECGSQIGGGKKCLQHEFPFESRSALRGREVRGLSSKWIRTAIVRKCPSSSSPPFVCKLFISAGTPAFP